MFPVIKSTSGSLLRTAQAVDQSVVRVANERAVLTLIAASPGLSAAEIARQTGLGSQTVGKIVEELQHRGLVKGGDVRRGARGQPATPLYLESNGRVAIGCEIGWRHCAVQLVNIGGEVLANHRWDYAFPSASTVFSEVASVVKLMVQTLPNSDPSKPVGIGLAAPGTISRNMPLLGASERQAALWTGLDIRLRIEEATGLMTSLFNDGTAACWAEAGMLPDPRPGNFVYFLISTFVAAGIVAEGRLWEGPTGNSADLGSMLVTARDGQQNFVHEIASIYALEKKLAAAGIEVPKGDCTLWDWDLLEPHVSEWIECGGYAIAKTIVNATAVFESSLAIIDGIMPRQIVDRLVESVRRHREQLPIMTTDRPTVRAGSLGMSAPSKGAAQLFMFRHFFSGEWEHFGSQDARRAPSRS